MFNPEIDPCRNCPRVAPNDYWLFNNNYLVMIVLRVSNPTLANEIEKTLQQYGYDHNNKIEKIDNLDILDIFYEHSIISLEEIVCYYNSRLLRKKQFTMQVEELLRAKN